VNIQLLKAKKRNLLLNCDGHLVNFIFDPKNVSPCGRYVLLGENHGDMLFGWHMVNEISDRVVSVLQEWEPVRPRKPISDAELTKLLENLKPAKLQVLPNSYGTRPVDIAHWNI